MNHRAAMALLLSPVLTGCVATGTTGGDVRTDAVVGVIADASVCWTAFVGGASQEGCGRRNFPVNDPLGSFSSSVQKKDDKPGEVAIFVMQDGEEVARNATSAGFGIAQVVIQPRG